MNRKRSLILALTGVASVLVGTLAGSLLSEGPRALAQPVKPLPLDLTEPKVQAHRFLLRDEKGNALAVLGAGDEAPALDLFDAWGGHRATIGVNDNAEACLDLYPEAGAVSFQAGVPETTATYAIVYNPDGTHAWAVPAGMANPAPETGTTTGIPALEPTAPAGPGQPTKSLEYDEVRGLEYIARDMEKNRCIQLFTSADGYPRAVFFDKFYHAPRVIMSVNEGGEADVRLLDRLGKTRLMFIAGPDTAGWVLFDFDGKAQNGFLTAQTANYPAVTIPGDH